MGRRAASPSRLLGLLAVVVLWPGAGSAQAARMVVHYPLRLIDLSIAPDTLSGLQILMQPSVESKQARDGGLIWLRFHPDTVMEWINGAAAALQVPVPSGPAEGIQWARTLKPVGGQGGVSLGRVLKKGRLDKTRWLAIGDSATGWRTELTASQADSLLKLLLVLGSQSRLDTSSSAPRDKREVDVQVSVIHQPPPRHWGKNGRVVASYVVDEAGQADPASFVAMLASSPDLVAEAWDMLRASRFKPAVLNGRPVRQLVRQVIQWAPYRPPDL
jgi:hypothetical protein